MFYVTAIDAGRVFLLAGPYDTKEAAEAKVSDARAIACDHSRNASAGRAHFMAYGASRWKADPADAPRAALGII